MNKTRTIDLTIKWPSNKDKTMVEFLDGATVSIYTDTDENRNILLKLETIEEKLRDPNLPIADFLNLTKTRESLKKSIRSECEPQVLKEGRCLFTSFPSNKKFIANISCSNTKFHVGGQGIPYTNNIFENDNSTEHSVIGEYWSVFQVLEILFNTSQEVLQYMPGKLLSVEIVKGAAFNSYASDTKTIKIKSGLEFGWESIAHEFAHYIADVANITKDATGGGWSNGNLYGTGKNQVNDKVIALSKAFSEGFAQWFGPALLKEGHYLGKKLTSIDNVGVEQAINLEGNKLFAFRLSNELWALNYSREKSVISRGEDSAGAIIALLWNINGYYDENKYTPKGDYVSNYSLPKKISLHDLFNNVLKGAKLKNISDFYQKLFNYYIFQNDPNKIAFDGYELKDLEKIGALGNLFAEFGIAPDIDNMTQEDNKLVWYQYKTGELPAHDTFEVFFFDEHLGDASRGYWLGETYECEIEPVKVSEGKYRYEYPINDIVWGNVELYDEDRIHLLIRVKNKKENLNTGPYLNYSMTDFTPSNIVSRYLGVVAHFPTNAVSLSGLGYVPAENGVFEFYFMDITSGEIHANYTGISGGEKNIPRYTITYYLGMDAPPYYGEIYIGS